MMGVSDQNMTYLDGTLPGDFGFDPLGMSDPEGAGGFVNPQWLAYSEVIHGRWAMLGVAGIVAPEILGGMGIIPESTGLVWFTSGAIPPQGTFDYWASPMTIFWVNMCLMNFAEIKRGQDYWFPGSQAETPLLGWEKGFGGSGKFILIIDRMGNSTDVMFCLQATPRTPAASGSTRSTSARTAWPPCRRRRSRTAVSP